MPGSNETRPPTNTDSSAASASTAVNGSSPVLKANGSHGHKHVKDAVSAAEEGHAHGDDDEHDHGKDDGHDHGGGHGHSHGSMNMHGVFLHVLGDA